MKTVLINAGPLIALGKLNRLSLLTELYTGLQVPRSVYREVVEEGVARGLPDALTVHLYLKQDKLPIVHVPDAILGAYEPQVHLDAGERELLALAQTLPEVSVLLDDEDARAEARRLGLTVKGTLGVLVQAYREQRVTSSELELLFLEIAARPDIWISEELCHQVLGSVLGRT